MDKPSLNAWFGIEIGSFAVFGQRNGGRLRHKGTAVFQIIFKTLPPFSIIVAPVNFFRPVLFVVTYHQTVCRHSFRHDFGHVLVIDGRSPVCRNPIAFFSGLFHILRFKSGKFGLIGVG